MAESSLNLIDFSDDCSVPGQAMPVVFSNKMSDTVGLDVDEAYLTSVDRLVFREFGNVSRVVPGDDKYEPMCWSSDISGGKYNLSGNGDATLVDVVPSGSQKGEAAGGYRLISCELCASVSRSEPSRVWICEVPECAGLWFSRFGKLSDHWVRFHRSVVILQTCSVCMKRFERKRDAEIHVKSHYPTAMLSPAACSNRRYVNPGFVSPPAQSMR